MQPEDSRLTLEDAVNPGSKFYSTGFERTTDSYFGSAGRQVKKTSKTILNADLTKCLFAMRVPFETG